MENKYLVIKQNKNGQWCIYHCHGTKIGQVIACHDTKEKAESQHRAIQASKDRLDIKKLFK